MTTSKTPKPRDGIVTESYRGPSGFQPDILRLDGNEGSKPDSALFASVPDIDISAVRSYPSTAALEAVLAARFGVSAERIVVTTGADDALDRICRAYLDHGRNIILPTPSFEMLARFATNAGGSITEVPWDADFPTDACIKAIRPTTSLLALVTPNNPSGKT
ncbi:MAG: aminotransferase class I/II-fold pyridoxal phosphate-dependent enzyme, partial [Gemmatimonadota bacterium]|nr:aminotransferase class I/II-fold pyridoxal phosphate-dependent enzyme [Gemmatimonadota bacterium]